MSHDVTIEIAESTKLSGLVLAGETQMLVGLSNSQWLRVPLPACPELRDLAGDDLLDHRLTDHRSRLCWPGHGIDLSVRDLMARAIALEAGDKGPD